MGRWVIVIMAMGVTYQHKVPHWRPHCSATFNYNVPCKWHIHTYKRNTMTFSREQQPVPLSTQIAKFVGPTWGPPGSCRPQMGPMSAQWTSLSGYLWLCKVSAFERRRYISNVFPHWSPAIRGDVTYVTSSLIAQPNGLIFSCVKMVTPLNGKLKNES